MTQPTIIARSAEKANVWLNEVAAEMGTEDRGEAYRALRAFLHVLRDRLPVAEVAELSAQLPVLIRGIYYEDWSPGKVAETYRDVDAFLDRVAHEARLAGETEASYAAQAVATVLRRHVSAGEIADVLATLPEGMRKLIAS